MHIAINTKRVSILSDAVPLHDAAEITTILIDSTMVYAHSCAAGALKKRRQQAQALGRSRSGFTTKINLSLSDQCKPLCFTLIVGQHHDITQATELLQSYINSVIKRTL